MESFSTFMVSATDLAILHAITLRPLKIISFLQIST